MGPFIKSENNTSKIMTRLLIALMPIVLFAYIKNGIIPYVKGYTTFFGMFYPLIFILISTLSTFIFEAIYSIIFIKNKPIKELIMNSYSIFPGLFLGLILPINTPIIILIIGSFISSIIAKMLFGGFGHNIFNPALVGRLFIISIYAIVIGKSGGYLNAYELDTITSPTPLTNAQTLGIGTYATLIKPYGSLLNFFIGTIPGALGETSALLCIIAFIYLTFFKVIKWKIPVTYITTVFAITYVIGGINDLGIWYPFFQIFSGGLMFGAVFMATDPVTSPVTPIGQVLYGLFLGILTVIFRFLTPFPEGVLTSILTMNMFVVILDKIGARARFDFKITLIPFIIAWLLILALSLGLSANYSKEQEQSFNIISKEVNGNKTSYIVTQRGYSGMIKASIILEDDKIITFEILEQNDSFYSKIKEEKYVERLKLSTEIDTVSGATVTSSAIKKMLMNTLEDYGKKITQTNTPLQPENFKIISKNTIDDNTKEYIVTNKGFQNDIKLQVIVSNKQISSIKVLEQNDSYFKIVEEQNYIDNIITNQQNIESIDTVSGATYSSKALKQAIINILKEEQYE